MRPKTDQHIQHEKEMGDAKRRLLQYLGAMEIAALVGDGCTYDPRTRSTSGSIGGNSARMTIHHLSEFMRAAEWVAHHEARRRAEESAA